MPIVKTVVEEKGTDLAEITVSSCFFSLLFSSITLIPLQGCAHTKDVLWRVYTLCMCKGTFYRTSCNLPCTVPVQEAVQLGTEPVSANADTVNN